MRKFLIILTCLAIFHNSSGGKLFEKLKNDVEVVEKGVECATKTLGSFLGLGKKCQHDKVKQIPTDIEDSGIQVVVTKKTVETVTKKSEGTASTQGLDMRYNGSGPDPNQAPVIEDSEEKKDENMEERRLINVASNCKPGYQADRRGRCKQVVG